MVIAVAFSFLWALAAVGIARRAGRWTGWILALGPLALFAVFLQYLPAVQGMAVVREQVPWVPSLDVQLTFALDGLSLLFALLITGLGAVIVVYAGRYMEGYAHTSRFYFALLAFLGAMLGLVLADNIILLFVFWEMTSLTSFVLIGFKHEAEKSRKAAWQALLVTAGGGLALLAGLLLLGTIAGTWELTALVDQSGRIQEHALYGPMLALIAIGAFTKSAQFPFHFWLPGAMAAPTPVSAYLHSATMVKAGIYLLARMDPILGGTALWIWGLVAVGGTTMLVGAVGAIRQTDLKAALAYSTIAALGTLVTLLGLSYDASIKAAIVFLIVHALYKSGLFLVAGSVDHATTTRDVLQLGGLRRAMPWTALAAVLAGLSMAGLPPLFGFVGKELTYKAKLGVEGLEWLLPSVAVAANVLTVVVAGVLVLRPFFGAMRAPRGIHLHEVRPVLWGAPLVVGALGVVLGVVPGLLYSLVAPAVDVVVGAPTAIDLALWYGVNTALLLSGVTVALGVVGYIQWDRLRMGLQRMDRWARYGPQAAYDGGLALTLRAAAWQTRLFDGVSVRQALAATFAVVTALVGGTLLLKGEVAVHSAALDVMLHEWVLAGAIAAASIVATQLRSTVATLAVIGIVGVGLALFFAMLSAPDLAMTQFLVEILVVVIVLLVLQQLPRRTRPEPRRRRLRDAGIALALGATVTVLLLAVLQRPLDLTVPQYYLTESVPQGFGRNVVNVILVDFRALDTLGEIAVIAVAALGAVLLLHGLRGGDRPARTILRPPSLVLQTGTRLMLALLVLAALFMLWRGHNAPGGGFIGGLMASTAVILYLIAFGRRAANRMVPIAPNIGLGGGLALAASSGLLAVAVGAPYMTGQWTTLGPLKLGTPLLFDVGVFIVVVSFVLTIVLALERTVNAPRRTIDHEPPPPRSALPETRAQRGDGPPEGHPRSPTVIHHP